MSNWVSRAEWGAPASVNCKAGGGPNGVAIHWMGPGQWTNKEPASVMRQVRGWHLANKAEGYCDIAYSLAVAEGVILEGRSTRAVPRIRTGANGTAAANAANYAVLVIAGDGDPNVTDRHLQTAGEAVRWLRENAGAGPHITGHRDHRQTECPGDYIYANLAKIAEAAAGAPPAPIPAPPVTGTHGGGNVYLGKLKYGQRDSDSVRNLQEVLRRHVAGNLPVTGNYLDQTDAAVRKCQVAHGFGMDPARRSFVGPKQANHLFPRPPYVIHA